MESNPNWTVTFYMKQTALSHRLRRWELALLLGTALAALLGVWLDGGQSALADRVIRLHVLANSDSQADQVLKLEVRDRVLAAAEACLPPDATREETEAILQTHLEELAAAGAHAVAAAGYDYPVTAQLVEDAWFPTKQYADFALPAGQYTALRVVIGAGAGQNWWCVLFPPLCLGSVTESAAQTALSAGLSEDQVALITGEDGGYVIKFRAMELWDAVKQRLSGG